MELGILLVGAIVLSLFVICGSLFISERVSGFMQKRRDARSPLVYICRNNGVTVLATPEKYKKAAAEYWGDVEHGVIDHPGSKIVLHTVPNAFLFSSINSLRGKVTGTEEAMEKLIRGCRVEQRPMYVPYTSGLNKPEEDAKLFLYVHQSLGLAYRMIWGKDGRRKYNLEYGTNV
jgi:hypothetical protein